MKAERSLMNSKHWICLSVLNFLLVAVFGLLMRLKFLFPIPWLDQKNIMHAHSHFAFAGWVSQALMVFLIAAVLRLKAEEGIPKKYQPVLWFNLLSSYGMLVSFSITGYAFFSISFSFLSVLASYWFAIILWKELKITRLPLSIIVLIKASLIYLALSSLGTYALVILKVTHQLDPLKQLASVYFFLHFQYNGWFFFACLSLASYWIYDRTGKEIMFAGFAKVYAFTVLPAYFLSVLWWKGFPSWLYVLLLLTVALQVILWTILLLRFLKIKRQDSKLSLARETTLIWVCVVLAVSVKLILQAISIIPSLSQLVYGFRPIVIAYLHLVLLVIISLFILGYAFQNQSLQLNKGIRFGIYGLLFGIFLNEFMLMIQGVAGLLRFPIYGTHEALGIAAVIMVISICLILANQAKTSCKEMSYSKTSF